MSLQMKIITSEVEDECRNRKSVLDNADDLNLPIGGADRQDAQWLRDYFKRVINEKRQNGTLTWMDLIREKFLELAAEPDTNWRVQRRSAIQMAANAVTMVEAGDLRASTQEAQNQGGDSEGKVQGV